ncbi:invasion associated locus B family protein [Albidovulum sp.]
MTQSRDGWRQKVFKSSLAKPLGCAVLLLVAATGAQAQVSTNRVAANTDWSVFVEDDPKECWTVSAPKETVNSRDGKPVSVRRSDIRLFVTYRPGSTAGEVSFTGGYPFAPDSTVTLEVGGSKFELFTEGEWAWAASPEDDKAILEALKAGASAKLTAHSSRGTQTEDTFSLLGLTAATDTARERCAG